MAHTALKVSTCRGTKTNHIKDSFLDTLSNLQHNSQMSAAIFIISIQCYVKKATNKWPFCLQLLLSLINYHLALMQFALENCTNFAKASLVMWQQTALASLPKGSIFYSSGFSWHVLSCHLHAQSSQKVWLLGNGHFSEKEMHMYSVRCKLKYWQSGKGWYA